MSVAADLRYAFRMLRLSPGFAAVAVITLSGMYAVMGYVTTRRTAEFDLRSAMGAQPANIVGLVFGGAIRQGIGSRDHASIH
jgi:hypothetical protein